MRLSDILSEAKNRKKEKPKNNSPLSVELTRQYKKTKESLSNSDPVLKKSVLRFEILAVKNDTRTPEEENEFHTYKPHPIPKIGSKKGKALLSPYQKAGYKLIQSHLASTQKRGRFVLVYGINPKTKTICFIIIGTHDQTTGG